MSSNTVQFAVRTLAVLIGLAGISMALVTIPVLIGSPSAGVFLFVGVSVAISLYLIFIGYRSLRGFSPWLVKQTCGTVAFFLLIGISHFCYNDSGELPTGVESGIVIGSLVMLIFAYRLISDVIIRKHCG